LLGLEKSFERKIKRADFEFSGEKSENILAGWNCTEVPFERVLFAWELVMWVIIRQKIAAHI
jgi:hypothetical protein